MSPKSRYKNIIQEAGNRLITIENAKKLKESSFSSAPALFGIIKYVQTEAQGISRSPKKTVTLIDPTDAEGLKVVIIQKDGIFHPGDILHIRVLSQEKRPRSVIFTAAAWDVSEVTSFTIDYDIEPDQTSGENVVRGESQREICHFLEEWFASQLLQTSALDRLPQPEDAASFVDLIIQVTKKQLMYQSVVISGWDGTIPVIPVSDPFIPEHLAQHPTDHWSEQVRNSVRDISNGFTVGINVWSNEEKSRTVCVHFETCVNQCNLEQDEFLLLLNVEVKRIMGNMISLTMRSGHHKGKSARIVKSCSVLGRMFKQKMSQSLSRVLERELSVTTAASETSDPSPRKRRTTIEVVTDRVPYSINRVRELMQKLPPESHLSAVFDNSIASLDLLRQNVLQLTDCCEQEETGLSADEFANLIEIVIQAKAIIE